MRAIIPVSVGSMLLIGCGQFATSEPAAPTTKAAPITLGAQVTACINQQVSVYSGTGYADGTRREKTDVTANAPVIGVGGGVKHESETQQRQSSTVAITPTVAMTSEDLKRTQCLCVATVYEADASACFGAAAGTLVRNTPKAVVETKN